MDIIRRNRQIDSLKYLILKCQDGNSLMSTVSSREESSKLSTETDNSIDTSNSRSGGAIYEDKLLNELTALSETRSRLHDAILLSDSSLLTDAEHQLPGATLLSDLVADIDQLGSRLARVGENMELLGWRLLQNKFTTGLDVPYEQHGAVKSLLSQMSVLISDINTIELSFQKAAMYKPNRRMGEDLTRAVRSLCDLRARLENIQTLRNNCRSEPGGSADTNSTSAPGLHDSELQDSVFSRGSTG